MKRDIFLWASCVRSKQNRRYSCQPCLHACPGRIGYNFHWRMLPCHRPKSALSRPEYLQPLIGIVFHFRAVYLLPRPVRRYQPTGRRYYRFHHFLSGWGKSRHRSTGYFHRKNYQCLFFLPPN